MKNDFVDFWPMQRTADMVLSSVKPSFEEALTVLVVWSCCVGLPWLIAILCVTAISGPSATAYC